MKVRNIKTSEIIFNIGLIASMVFGLFFHGALAAQMPLASVSLSEHTKSVAANHSYRLQTPSGVDSPTDTITLDVSSWSAGAVSFSDIDFLHGPVTGLETNNTLAAAPAAGTWGASLSGGVLTLSPPTDAAPGTINPGDYLTIYIGTNATGGVNRLTNPATAGSYPITVGGGFGDIAYMAQAITNVNGVNVDATVGASLVITNLNPSSVQAGSGAFIMTVTGSGFASSSIGRIDGADRPTVYVSSTELQVSILASDVVSASTRQITVHNPVPGITSNQLPLSITSTGGGGGPSQDLTPPTILNPQAINITQTSARIIWDTDESATSRVDYGLTNAYGDTVSNSSLVLSHGLDLTGLTASTTYHFRVQSADQYGNNAVSADYTFTTLPWPPLEISNVTSTNITDTTAIIIWDTNRAANSRVEYGLTPALGMFTTQAGLVTSHSTPLSSLSPETIYYYRVISYDINGIGATSPIYTFRTTSDQTPPTNITLTATPGDTIVNLVWTHPPEPDFAAVRLIRKTGGFPTGPFDGTLVYDGLATSTVDTGLTNGTTYYYAAYAYDTNGNFASGALDDATPTGTPLPPTPTTTPPVPPATTTPPTPPATTTPPLPGTTTTTPSAPPALSITPIYYGAGGSLLLEPDDSGVRGVLPNESVLVLVPVASLGESAESATITVNGQIYSLTLSQDGTEFTGTFPAPASGLFPSQVSVTFVSGAIAGATDNFSVQDLGEVVESKIISGITPVPGATVTLYQIIDGNPILWNGAPYGQANPTLSDSNGDFVFRVPNGEYYVEVGKVGYSLQRSPVITVNRNVFGDRVELIYVPEPLIIESCKIDCSLVTYDLYIVNPNGTERHINTEYVVAESQGEGITLYRFEDGADFDYNDVLVQVDHSDCQHLKFVLLKTDANLIHQVRAKIFYDGTFRKDILLTSNSQQSYGKTINLDLASEPSLCEEVEKEIQIEVIPEQIEFAALTGIDIIREPEIVEITDEWVVPAITAVSVINIGAALGLFNLLTYLQFLFTQPILLFGRLRKRRWGVVYNALTKQPVEMAIVRLLHKETGMVVQSRVTDKQGRYYFRAKQGNYILEVVKPDYNFPTRYLKTKKQDAVFADLYHGETINLTEDGFISVNIPLDPERVAEAPRKVIYKAFFRKLQHFIAILGIVLAVVSLIISPTWFVGIVLLLQIGFYLVFRQLAIPAKAKSWGKIYDAQTKKPVNNAVVRIFDKQYNKLLETQLSSKKGRYGFFAEHNTYYITVEKQGYEKYTSKPLDLKSQKDTIIDLNIPLRRNSPK